MVKGSGTRSGLLWEVERLLDECTELPQILLMENVPQVIGKKNIEDFQKWRSKLESLGYSNYVQLLNAKDYGIPQNRNRCFMVSILGEWFYEFPKKKPLKLKLKDMLEDKVDEKYYLSDKVIESFVRYNEKQKEMGNTFKFDPIERERERARTIKPGASNQRSDDNYIIEPDTSIREQGSISPTPSTQQTESQEPYKENLSREVPSKSLNAPSKEISQTVRGGVQRTVNYGECKDSPLNP